MLANHKLLIRADASQQIGAGHVMRCLALAQEWMSRGGTVTVAFNELAEPAKARLEHAGIMCEQIGPSGHDTREFADSFNPDWVVIDTGDSVHEHLAALGNRFPTLIIDDVGAHFEIAPSLLLNQNAYGLDAEYVGIDVKRRLLGLDYVLLRDEFVMGGDRLARQRPAKHRLRGDRLGGDRLGGDRLGGDRLGGDRLGGDRLVRGGVDGSGISEDDLVEGGVVRGGLLADQKAPEALQTLVAMGGTDPLRLLPIFAEQLATESAGIVCAATSSRHPDLDLLRKLDETRNNFELHVDVADMSQLMQRCDLALTSGGTTVWELAFMGVPSLVGTVVNSEERNLAGLRSIGLFEVLGPFSEMSPQAVVAAVLAAQRDQEWLSSMSTKASNLIDGNGRHRVVDQMAKTSGPNVSQ